MVEQPPKAPESALSTSIEPSDMAIRKTDDTSPNAASQNGKETPQDHDEQKQTTVRIILLIASAFITVFLVALDRTIISTAIPEITNEFNSLTDVGWYGSAYLLTCCAFQLSFGKIYTLYPVKLVLISSIMIFEVGSAICGAAPNSDVFIFGRALAGIGAAGCQAGSIVTVVHAVPLPKRPMLQGGFAAIYGLASIFGPLVGGAFTTHVTWRWCFYINLPIGGIALVVIAICLKDVPSQETAKLPWAKKLLHLDFFGSAALLPGVVCLLLALQWGGQTYAWNNARIITLLVLMSLLLPAFIVIQLLLPKTAMIPTRIFKNQRSVAFGLWTTICNGCSMYIYVYFLPIWFQSIKHISAISSGIHLLPIMLSMTLSALIGGATIQKLTGYYTGHAILGSCMMAIGAGLLTTLQVDSTKGIWIGYQILYGLGLGLAFPTPNLAVQTVLPKPDVPIGLALMFFGQLLGAAVIVAVGENVLSSQLLQRMDWIPGFDARLVTSGGATSLLDQIPEGYRDVALVAYNGALRKVFQIGLVVSCLGVLGAAGLEWRSVHGKQGGEGNGKTVDDERAQKTMDA